MSTSLGHASHPLLTDLLKVSIFLMSSEGSFHLKRTCVFRDMHLVDSHQVVETRVHFILKPSKWITQVVVWVYSDGQFSRDGIPGVFVHLPIGALP